MPPARIELHIERLVLDGFTLTGAQGRALQAALETELSRLLAADGLGDAFAAGFTVAGLPPLSAALSPHAPPAAMGRDLARTLYAGIAPAALASPLAAGSGPQAAPTEKGGGSPS